MYAPPAPPPLSTPATHVSREEAHVLPLDVLPEGHLEQRQAHVQRLDDVALAGQRVVPGGGGR